MSGYGAPVVPAWKRLGLKLKGPAAGGGSSGEAAPAPAPANTTTTSPASALKRKFPTNNNFQQQQTTPYGNKRSRYDTNDYRAPPRDLKTATTPQKSVSFAEDTKPKAAKKPKTKKKKPAKKAAEPAKETNLEPSLDYIRQWDKARAAWKFNKNHQTLLIKYLFDVDIISEDKKKEARPKIPSADVAVFYRYIRDLKGFVRTRLRETAAELKKKDMEAGPGGFPATLKDKEAKQAEYEEVIARFLQDQLKLHQQEREEEEEKQKEKEGGKNASNGKKRTFDEVEFVIRVTDPAVKQRLLKRIRAEIVLDELADSEGESTATTATSTATATATTTTTSSSSASTDARVRARSTDGSQQQPAKRRRLRNVRTAGGDDSDSSSDSDSSDSDSSDGDDDDEDTKKDAGDDSSSSSSSSSDEDSDEEMAETIPGQEDGSSSSSSSSSSASSSEAGSDAESDDSGGNSSSDESDSD